MEQAMIKFISHRGARKLLGIGLSQGNVDRLKKKQPVWITGEEVGISNLDIMIMYGETEQSIADELSGFKC